MSVSKMFNKVVCLIGGLWFLAAAAWPVKFVLGVVIILHTALSGQGLGDHVQLLHDNMAIKIGQPAVIKPGENYPSIRVNNDSLEYLKVTVISEEDGSIEKQIISETITSEEKEVKEFNGTPDPGRYRIDIQMALNGAREIRDSFYFSVVDIDRLPENYSVAVYPGDQGRLIYTPDYRGNRIPDFSNAGYMGGCAPIPEIPLKIRLLPAAGDDTDRIQKAIDEVGRMPPDSNGFRGAVLLKAGVYEVQGSLHIHKSGTVLRGEGSGGWEKGVSPQPPGKLEEFKPKLAEQEGTIILATGKDRRTLINVSGSGGAEKDEDAKQRIIDHYVPVGTDSFKVENADGFEIGDSVIVQRYGNREWIHAIGMDRIPARPCGRKSRQWSPFYLNFDRVITDIESNMITIDAPIVNAIEKEWGGGSIYGYEDPGRISQAAVEGLRLVSMWSPDKHDKDHTRHADSAVRVNNAKNVWIDDVVGEHFYSEFVGVGRGAKWVTIRNSASLIAENDPYYTDKKQVVSGRVYLETDVYTGRYGFNLAGQLTLVRDCYAINNRHAYAVGSRVAGLNVFLESVADKSTTWSEPHHRWSVGGLYDNVHDKIALMNRLWYGTGHGWAGANYVAWNTAGELVCQQPPTAQNWAIGHIGKRSDGPFADYGDPGYWEAHGHHVDPQSLYLRQLHERQLSSKSRDPAKP